MEQIFPTPVDDVDTTGLYAADDRPSPDDRPWVMCNMISSADGAIAVDGVSGGLGGPGDKAVFRAVRGVADVIIVGSGTVTAENYRRPQTPVDIQQQRVDRGQAPFPRIAIVSRSLSIDPEHRVFDPEARPLIITTTDSNVDRRERLAGVADTITAGAGVVDLRSALSQLRSEGMRVALVEGGPTLNGAFVDRDLIDELCLSFSPTLVGGDGPRIVANSDNRTPHPLRLDRVLHDAGFLFHRYVRARGGDATTDDRTHDDPEHSG